jgi:isoleucyl-tRNA synthetase
MMEGYDVTGAARAIEGFVEDLSNWYVRRNRRRFWKSENDSDKLAAYQTLYEALVTVTKLIAPFTPFLSEELYRNLVLPVNPAAPESVHLADYPIADESLVDEQLLKDMDSVMKVVSVGLAARKAAKFKVRQPLLEVLVKPRTNAEAGGLRKLEQQVLEELNVKSLTVVESGSDLMSYTLKANFKLLGPKLGKRLPELQKALAALSEEESTKAAAQVKAGQNLTVQLGEESLELAPDEVLVEAKQKAGYAVAEDGGYVVALNTTVSPELKREGLLRDLVRFIQAARKEANFNISDTITTYYTVVEDTENFAGELAEALADPQATRYVQSETLSSQLVQGQPGNGAFSQTVDLEGAKLVLNLVKN